MIGRLYGHTAPHIGQSPTFSRGIAELIWKKRVVFCYKIYLLVVTIDSRTFYYRSVKTSIRGPKRNDGNDHETASDKRRRAHLHPARAGCDLPGGTGGGAAKRGILTSHIRRMTATGHAPILAACSRPISASLRRASRCAGVSIVGQPIRCCSAISAMPTIQAGLSFRHGM